MRYEEVTTSRLLLAVLMLPSVRELAVIDLVASVYVAGLHLPPPFGSSG